MHGGAYAGANFAHPVLTLLLLLLLIPACVSVLQLCDRLHTDRQPAPLHQVLRRQLGVAGQPLRVSANVYLILYYVYFMF
jgi:hypothetical protein